MFDFRHSVVTTVRTQEKADKIASAYKDIGKDKLSFAIVPDIAQEGAFEKAVVSDPPFDYVVCFWQFIVVEKFMILIWLQIHTASPFHFNVTDVQKQLLDPAIIGTTGILKSVKKNAPSIKRVVSYPKSLPQSHPIHEVIWKRS